MSLHRDFPNQSTAPRGSAAAAAGIARLNLASEQPRRDMGNGAGTAKAVAAANGGKLNKKSKQGGRLTPYVGGGVDPADELYEPPATWLVARQEHVTENLVSLADVLNGAWVLCIVLCTHCTLPTGHCGCGYSACTAR